MRSLPDGQRRQQGTQGLPVGDRVEARVGSAEGVDEGAPILPAGCRQGIQRLGAMARQAFSASATSSSTVSRCVARSRRVGVRPSCWAKPALAAFRLTASS
jgi:hypothetical protein